MSETLNFINGLLVGASGSNLSGSDIGARSYTFINGLLTNVSPIMPGAIGNQQNFSFINGLLVNVSGSISGSVTPPPPPSPPSSTIWVAGVVVTGSGLAYSYDGINWNHNTSTIFAPFGSNGLCTNGNKFVAVGEDTIAYNYNYAYSSDGINWTRTAFQTNNLRYCVVWDGSKFLSGGGGGTGGSGIFTYSYNAINWYAETVALIGQVYTICWNGAMFISGGYRYTGGGADYHNNMAYSTDGFNWNGLGTNIFSSWCYGIATNGNRWVAVGQGTTNTIAYSDDGINWIGLGNSIFSVWGWCIAWNGTMFIAGGTGGANKIAYSYDGINWTGLGDPLSYGTAYNQQTPMSIWWDGIRFLIGSSNETFPYSSLNTLGYSYDGINWIGLGKDFSSAFISIVSNHSSTLIPPV